MAVAVAVAAVAEAKAATATVAVGTKTHGKRKNSAQTATSWSSTIPRSVSASRQTRSNAPQDEAPNTGNDRGPGSQDYDAVLKWISKNKPQRLSILTPLRNYWTPLASQVEELDKQPPPMDLLFSIILSHAESRLSCHPITLTRIARPGGVDTHPTSKRCIASTLLRPKTTCAWAY
jgi:hypothetical protein